MIMPRTLPSSPRLPALYARAAAASIPGAGRLPFLPGGGGPLPDLELRLEGICADPAELEAYRRLCGFGPGRFLPGSYPHILAFPVHMALMTDRRFPCGPAGLVHVENAIHQHRPIPNGQALDLRVRAGAPEPHPRGRTFSLFTQAHVAGELVWQSTSTMLHTSRGHAAAAAGGAPRPRGGASAFGLSGDPLDSERWELGGDLGRRYAALSGDRNPIHLHPLPARALGFPGVIAHGMWTNARMLAALAEELPGSFSALVSFRSPIVLPAVVHFASVRTHGETEVSVRSEDFRRMHMRGRVRPLDPNLSIVKTTGGQAK